jgi:hypothetical protein
MAQSQMSSMAFVRAIEISTTNTVGLAWDVGGWLTCGDCFWSYSSFAPGQYVAEGFLGHPRNDPLQGSGEAQWAQQLKRCLACP